MINNNLDKIYVKRSIEDKILPFLKRSEVISIIGPRQSGKTTLLIHLQKELLKKNKKNIFITFENKKNLELFNDPEEFITFYQDYDVLIIDEFHYAKDGGQKLKFLYDTTRKKFIISGSSSLELTFQTGKYMVGRMISFKLMPFSFEEFLLATNKPLLNLYKLKKPLTEITKKNLLKSLETYLVFGGYPAVVLAKSNLEKEKILESIIDNYLLKDIKDLLTLTTDDKLILLAKLLSGQIGNLLNYNELSTLTNLSYKQLLKHIEILKKTFILDFIRPYSRNKRTEIVKNPKVYFFDLGFRNYLLSDFRFFDKRNDIGQLIENFIFKKLYENQKDFEKINFWRTKNGGEVDFVIEKQKNIIPFEVKYSSSPTIGKSLYSFIEKYKPKKAFIITKDFEKKLKIKSTQVYFLPIFKF